MSAKTESRSTLGTHTLSLDEVCFGKRVSSAAVSFNISLVEDAALQL